MTKWHGFAYFAMALAIALTVYFYVDGLTDELSSTQADVQSLAEQIRDLGATPVVEPGEPGTPGEQGPPGPGPSETQIQAAVTLYCANGRCDGRNPTISQVQAAVATYCNANGDCRGKSGTDGQDGRNGQDSEVPGPQGAQGQQGPPPTAAQVLDAVNTYCSNHDGCRGPQGPQGDTGATGPAGSVAPGSYACPDGQVQVGFTVHADGSASVACRQAVLLPGGGVGVR